MNSVVELVKKDTKLRLILLSGILVQFIICIVQLGFYHPDQHFQIIEFSSHQLHKASGASAVWEFTDFIRPTLQIYLFSAYRVICEWIHITTPYLQLTLLRLIIGLFSFCLFNLMTIYYLRRQEKRTLYFALAILNFSWVLPYTRTLFGSELMSSIFFFGTLFFYDLNKEKKGFLIPFISGILFCLSFYFRFQIGFAIVGFGLWVLLVEKKYSKLIPLVLGAVLAAFINTYLDYHFYHQFIISPYNYFHVNITQGKAASFSSDSFLVYIAVLIAVITVPPFSIILFYYGLKSCFKKIAEPVVISALLFVVGHCFVAHKEERFFFPILNVLPIVIGLSLPDFMDYLNRCKKWIALFIKSIFGFSLILNFFLLVTLMIVPYSQTVYFSKLITEKFENGGVTIYCLNRTPFETENHLPLAFYQTAAPNIQFKKIINGDSIRNINSNNIYLVSTFNDLKQQKLLDSLGYKPQFFSSRLLWNINEFLKSKNASTINDIWILYYKK